MTRNAFASRRVLPALAAVLLLGAAAATPALAHHAFSAEFDSQQALALSGVVTKAKWTNPHCWLYFDVKNADGTVTNWGVEFSTPNALSRMGLTKEDVKIGTEVRIRGYKARNGGPFGYSVNLTLPDGRVFQTGGAQDGPAAVPASAAR